MALRFSDEVGMADWISASPTRWDILVTFGPLGVFPAHGRLRFIPDPTPATPARSKVELPDDHPSDFAQARHALQVLTGFTTTPDDAYFCVWDGYSALPPAVANGPLVVVPHRLFALLRGALDDIDGWHAALGDAVPLVAPAFVWPADRSWILASDVDPHWAGIGASSHAVQALVDEPTLDVVPADPSVKPPAYT